MENYLSKKICIRDVTRIRRILDSDTNRSLMSGLFLYFVSFEDVFLKNIPVNPNLETGGARLTT